MKRILLAACVLAVTAIACASPTTPSRVRPVETRPAFDGSVTPANIDQVDPNALFWEMFHRQAQQPVLHTRREYFDSPDLAAQRRMVKVQDEIYDFRTRRYVGASIEHWRGRSTLWGKCIDGVEHDYSPSRQTWSPGSSPLCRPYRPFLGDGIIPAGLTADQAAAMISQLNKESWRFLVAERPSLVEVNGATHLRLPVRARALPDDEGRRWDMQHLIWAFQKVGPNVMEHPFPTADNTSAGADIVYYLDPESLLPAYMFRQAFRPSDGGPKPDAVTRVEYVRPPELPADPLADTTPWALSWAPDVR
ncbi:hypothetical protein [Saccharopolyspora sp. NPDC002376]